jgi:hypothetical protein
MRHAPENYSHTHEATVPTMTQTNIGLSTENHLLKKIRPAGVLFLVGGIQLSLSYVKPASLITMEIMNVIWPRHSSGG